MNGWLLFSIHNLDDVPLQFFRTKTAALAARPWAVATDNPLGSWDITGHIGWKLLRFVKGKPVPYAEFYDTDGNPEEAPPLCA